jgi:glycopeptide antibiotics resistance protein
MMKFKGLLGLYLVFLVVMVVVPLGELNTTLSDTLVLELRLDYLVHALVFVPVVVLWKLGFPGQSLWKIVGVGMVLAVGLEGVQYFLPYRSWNVNDAVGNMCGVGIGWLVLGIKRWGQSCVIAFLRKGPQKHNNTRLTPSAPERRVSATSGRTGER